MNIASIELFVDVAQLGSFAAVARKENLDPSSVSRTIATLEQQLGLRLFQRTTRRLVLTEAGELYLNRVSPLINEFKFALDEAHQVSKGPSGVLRITTSVAFGQVYLLPCITEFKTRFPNIKIELQLTDTVVDIVASGIDLACRLAPRNNADLVGTRLFDTHYHVCVSPEYYNQMELVEQPGDLAKYKCVVFTLPEYRSRWIFRDEMSNINRVKISSDVSISSAMALREAALMGMGPTLLADWMVKDDIAEGRLIHLLQQFQVTAEDFDTAAWLLYPSRHFLPNKTRVMIDFLKEKFGDEKNSISRGGALG